MVELCPKLSVITTCEKSNCICVSNFPLANGRNPDANLLQREDHGADGQPMPDATPERQQLPDPRHTLSAQVSVPESTSIPLVRHQRKQPKTKHTSSLLR